MATFSARRIRTGSTISTRSGRTTSTRRCSSSKSWRTASKAPRAAAWHATSRRPTRTSRTAPQGHLVGRFPAPRLVQCSGRGAPRLAAVLACWVDFSKGNMMDWTQLMSLIPGLTGGGDMTGTFSGAPVGGGFGSSVGNPIAGAFGGGAGSGLSIANGQMPMNMMPDAGAYGLYQQPSSPADEGPDFAKAKMVLGVLGMGGTGGAPQPQQATAPGVMAGGGGGGNTRGLFSSLMRQPRYGQVAPTVGLLNNVGY
ncbi:hypothetical protein CBM2600_A120513 [Cupriavidus taiwanensis]|nr:hypothetical protein CBM2600_A120513 [Cupriavidus taiwanensis]